MLWLSSMSWCAARDKIRLGRMLFGGHRAGLLAAGLFLVHPAALGLARGETSTMAGIALLLLACLASLHHGRRPTRLGFSLALVALATVASFRLMGPLLAPIPGLILIGSCWATGRTTRSALPGVLATVSAVALSAPHLLQMATMMIAELEVRAGTDTLPPTLLDAPLWTPGPWVLLGLLGGLVLLASRPWVGALLLAWAAIGLLAPSSSAAFHQDQARYQGWMLPAVALLGAGGLEAMLKLVKMKVLIIGMKGVGIECAKNTTLAGVHTMGLHDPNPTELNDLGSNFFLTEDDIGKSRAGCCVPKVSELNEKVRVKEVTELSGPMKDSYTVYLQADRATRHRLTSLSRLLVRSGDQVAYPECSAHMRRRRGYHVCVARDSQAQDPEALDALLRLMDPPP